MACTWIHNYIIQQDHQYDKQFSSVEEEIDGINLVSDQIAPLIMSYLSVVPDKTFEIYSGVSHTREAIVEFLRESEFLQPLHNVERKKR
jgi:hypothetical protein